jgi:[acyl-carrier-protein] S-malonyltransferase
VRWVESVEAMAAMGVTDALEIGPGAVLAGLVRRIRKEISVTPVGKADQVAT